MAAPEPFVVRGGLGVFRIGPVEPSGPPGHGGHAWRPPARSGTAATRGSRPLNAFVERQSYVDPRHAPGTRSSLRDWIRPAEGRADWHRIAKRLDYASRLGEIDRAVLVLCRAHDPQFPLACSRQLVSGIPGSRLVVLDRSGHYPFVEEPTASWREVGAFLGSEGPGDRER